MTVAATAPVSIVSATGMLGTGFLASSLDAAIALGARAIGCDAGSSDSGPYCLGSGKLSRSHSALKRDLELMIVAGCKAGIPVAVGSAVNAGADAQLAEAVLLVEEIAREHRLNFKLAVIHSELSRDWLLDAWRSGRVRPQTSVPELDEKTIGDTAHLVAQMGPEPFMAALDAGADVVIAGRASDAAIFAALAMHLGVAPGPAWHAGKILECGAAPAIQRLHPDCILATFEGGDSFTIQIPNPKMACSELSVRAHGYYENADPFQIHEPGGTIDTAQSRFAELEGGRVRIVGSRFLPAERYEIRVEGSRLAGYRSIAVAGISDPILLDNLGEFLSTCEAAIVQKCRESLGIESGADYRLVIRRYGAPQGAEDATATHRVGLVFEVVAATQANAHAAAAVAVHTALHHPVRNWQGFVSNLAIPFSPAVFDGGAVYEWSLNHLVAIDDARAPFRIEMKTITRGHSNAAR